MNIEELAKEAGFKPTYIVPSFKGRPYAVIAYGCTPDELERFARLVAEKCAGICDNLPSTDPKGPWFNDDMAYAALECVNAIRQEFGL